jgi:hypothetical protein
MMLFRLIAALLLGAAVLSLPACDAPHRPERQTSARGAASPAPARQITAESVPRPFPSSPFLNANLDVRYVGSGACAECHASTCGSYHTTQHARALTSRDLAEGVPAGAFDDAETARRYVIDSRGETLWHHERLILPDGTTVALAEHPLRYGLGSGQHWRTYLIEVDGFLMESPATWYASADGWGLSPGYQHNNVGFQRPVDLSCLFCHAGNVETVSGSPQRVRIGEEGISCERCHGPGELHVRQQAAGLPAEPDFTIVNPRRLTRDLQEDICAQCHLRSAATVELAGRERQHFRPGLPLHEFRIDYALSAGDKPMKVVGHVEQLRLSGCRQASATLTCNTCHPPHAPWHGEEAALFQRQQCLRCHEASACGVPETQRRETTAVDDCTQCHMPRTPIDVPHFAFTHHRIGIHKSSAGTQSASDASLLDLAPLSPVEHLSDWERERALGLAYLEASEKPTDAEMFGRFRHRAQTLLERCRARAPDAGVLAGLSQLDWNARPNSAIAAAQAALQAPGLTPALRLNAQIAIATASFNHVGPAAARAALQELTRVRRSAEDWFLLALCEAEAGRRAAAFQAAAQGAEIDPSRPEIQDLLARLAEELGRPADGDRHRRRAAQLRRGAARPSSPANRRP